MHYLKSVHTFQSDQPFEIELLTVSNYYRYLKNRRFAINHVAFGIGPIQPLSDQITIFTLIKILLS